MDLVVRAHVKNLVFSYGEKKVLNGIKMPIYENRITALIGPSGCGENDAFTLFQSYA